MNKNKSFLIDNESNYLSNIPFTDEIIISKFIIVLHYYITYSIENTNNINDSIFFSGMYMTINVFRLLLYYTKNLELTLLHTQNAIYYYVEYMSQITDSDHNLFFNLSIKDAITYVYSRTIFTINKKYMKSNDKKQNNLLKKLTIHYNEYTNIINNIGHKLLEDSIDIKDQLSSISDIYMKNFSKNINYNIFFIDILKDQNNNLDIIIKQMKNIN